MIDKSVISNPSTRYGHKGHGTRLFKLQRLTGMINLAALLFFIQIFATLGYAVLYSSLVLYATEQLRFSAGQATLVASYAYGPFGEKLNRGAVVVA